MVGTPVAQCPPCRSVRAVFPHTAPRLYSLSQYKAPCFTTIPALLLPMPYIQVWPGICIRLLASTVSKSGSFVHCVYSAICTITQLHASKPDVGLCYSLLHQNSCNTLLAFGSVYPATTAFSCADFSL